MYLTSFLQDHTAECSKLPVACPNFCGRLIPREMVKISTLSSKLIFSNPLVDRKPGETPIQNGQWCSPKIFKRTPNCLRGTIILFCGRDLNFFSRLRGTHFYITHFSFGLNTLKGTAKSSSCGPFEAKKEKPQLLF